MARPGRNPGPLTYASCALPTALRGPATGHIIYVAKLFIVYLFSNRKSDKSMDTISGEAIVHFSFFPSLLLKIYSLVGNIKNDVKYFRHHVRNGLIIHLTIIVQRIHLLKLTFTS